MAECRQEATCAVDGCPNEAAPRKALCWAHVKRRQRGESLESPPRRYGRTLFQAICDAARIYANAEDEEDFRRARRLLAKRVELYAKAARNCPPRDKN